MTNVDMTAPEGFKAFSDSLAHLVAVTRTGENSMDPHVRCLCTASALSLSQFDPDELRAMLAIAMDLLAFPDHWTHWEVSTI